MKEITYARLCEMISAGNRPFEIKVNGTLFRWDEDDYRVEGTYEALHSKYTFYDLISSYITIESMTCFTEDERKYLLEVIKPYREETICISKWDYYSGSDDEMEQIYIEVGNYTFRLPPFPHETKYKKMPYSKRFEPADLEVSLDGCED